MRNTELAFILTLVVVPLFSTPRAGDGKEDTTYRDLVKRVNDGDNSVDFRALRFACLAANDCDPRGDNKDSLAVRQAMQKKEFDKAAKTAEEMINKGFANIRAHALAAQAYEASGQSEKAKFHHDVTEALIRSILKSGDGKSKETAFEVIGTFEEYVVMEVLGLPLLGSQSLSSGKPHSYDVQERDDPKTGKKISVYFNIDAFYPMKGLR